MILNDFFFFFKQLFSRELNYELSDNQIMKFYDYMNFLISENKKYNLTAITDPYDIINKHFLDSCELLRFVDLSFGNKHYIDIGCGAGFPSVPLAILFENSSFTLVDSVNKKLSFINELSNRINLQNIITFHARAERSSPETGAEKHRRTEGEDPPRPAGGRGTRDGAGGKTEANASGKRTRRRAGP